MGIADRCSMLFLVLADSNKIQITLPPSLFIFLVCEYTFVTPLCQVTKEGTPDWLMVLHISPRKSFEKDCTQTLYYSRI